MTHLHSSLASIRYQRPCVNSLEYQSGHFKYAMISTPGEVGTNTRFLSVITLQSEQHSVETLWRRKQLFGESLDMTISCVDGFIKSK